MEYIYTLEDAQVRKAFEIFSFLSDGGVPLSDILIKHQHDSGGSGITDDLMILIRKNLSNPSVQMKRIGIMGAIAMVRKYGSSQVEDVQIVHLLKQILQNCKKSAVLDDFVHRLIYTRFV